MSTIDEVKSRLDIVETVSGYVADLKKAGRGYKALCPFHSERTPSFTVDAERGTWHCFGACSTGGDVIEFVRRIEHLEFPDALRLCAQRAGVELRPASPREREQREAHERLLRANEAAAVFFQAALDGPAGADALRYLEERGIDAETRSRWQLGYAPDGWRGLLEHLQARGFAEADVVEAGLAVHGDSGVYDRFRDRLIFPTRDGRGRMVGFGARALRPDDEPKYLNTPQTPLFDKSGTLYGLDRAGEPARRADRLIVVEGYMDVIAAHQFGIENVVASMGTAITEKQMNLVKRFTHNVVLVLDADEAGAEAALRGQQVIRQGAESQFKAKITDGGLLAFREVLNAELRVVALPEDEDPDSLIRTDPARFHELVSGASSLEDYLFDDAVRNVDVEEPHERTRVLDTLAPIVAAMVDPVVRAHYVQRLARLTRVAERVVTAAVARHGRGFRPRAVRSPADLRGEVKPASEVPDGETQLLQLLLHRSESRAAGLALDADTFEETANRRLFEAWRTLTDLDERAEELDGDVRERLEQLLASAPEWLHSRYLDARYVDKMVGQMATQLRLRRAEAQLAPAAVEQADRVQAARRAGATVLESAVHTAAEGPAPAEAAGEAAELASEFVDISQRQRELTRQYQTSAGRRSSSRGDVDREETADDADA